MAQGCSDAGFCTINSFKPNTQDSVFEKKNQIKIGISYGAADHDIMVLGNYLEYNRQISNKLSADVKLASLAQNGNSIASFGLADLFVNANYSLKPKLRLTLGAKLPLSKADKKENNLPLPMDYQASLGTVDLILGIGYEIKKVQLIAALQQPLTQNDNEFLASLYPAASAISAIQSTRQFQRSADVLLRVSYPISIIKKLVLTPGLLPIYHLANDRYTDELNIEREIKGSEGLTLNGTLFLDYTINRRHALQFNAGMPFVVRDTRPDGLTRSFIASLEYRFRF
jgi:hypothetical protein